MSAAEDKYGIRRIVYRFVEGRALRILVSWGLRLDFVKLAGMQVGRDLGRAERSGIGGPTLLREEPVNVPSSPGLPRLEDHWGQFRLFPNSVYGLPTQSPAYQ